jgi:hypothetical protein
VFIAIVLGVWTLVSIVVSPLIGYFLFALGKREQRVKRSAADSRFRPTPWNYLSFRRHENVRRAGLTKFYRREAKGPRAV